MGSDRCDPPNTRSWRLCRHARQVPLRSPLRCQSPIGPPQTQTRRYSNARAVMRSLPGNDSAVLDPVPGRCAPGCAGAASGILDRGSARGAPPESRSERRDGRKPSNKGMRSKKYPLTAKAPYKVARRSRDGEGDCALRKPPLRPLRGHLSPASRWARNPGLDRPEGQPPIGANLRGRLVESRCDS